MSELARRLLAEKLIDDFYEDDVRGAEPLEKDGLTEQLKTLVPSDKQELLFLWEAQCAEECGRELRRFAVYVAKMILEYPSCADEME
ncbi:MAG: hypothetical protein ACYCYO_09105 [Bacilli bacterium]